MLKSRQRATFKPLSSSSVVMKAALNKIRRNFPNCRNFKKCGRKSKSQRATFCEPCFKARAAQSGARSAGNRTGNPGNNGNRTGKTGNKGNTKKGIAKKRAGARSGVKRSSKVALVVKKRWLDKILAGEKDWEIRSSNTSRRGWIQKQSWRQIDRSRPPSRLFPIIESRIRKGPQPPLRAPFI